RQVAVVALLARLNLPIATAGVEHGDRDGIDGKQRGAVPGTVQVYPEHETEIGGVDVRGSPRFAPQVTRVAEQQKVAVIGDVRGSVGRGDGAPLHFARVQCFDCRYAWALDRRDVAGELEPRRRSPGARWRAL